MAKGDKVKAKSALKDEEKNKTTKEILKMWFGKDKKLPKVVK